MSRIAGCVSKEKNGGELVSRMASVFSGVSAVTIATFSSRIPGGGFLWCGSSATSPIVSEGGVSVALDGHIYNRDELDGGGNDARIIFETYRKHGFRKAATLINGDCVVALFDEAIHTLMLARDRLGTRPLYYVAKPDLFAFASHPMALLALAGVSAEVNKKFVALFAASHYRYFDNDSGASPYRDIKQLPAAHTLIFHEGHVSVERYWELKEEPDFSASEEELGVEYREHLFDAVSRRLAAAEKPAFTLSGGMDSSSVLASAVTLSGKKQHAFSVTYEDPTYDESVEIKSMLDGYVAEWHPLSIGNSEDIWTIVKRMIAANGEPVATATWLSHFLLCEHAGVSGFKSFFGGLGGDELNAGEYEYFVPHFADLRSAGRDSALTREITEWIRYHNHPVFVKSFETAEEGLRTMVDLNRPGVCLPDLKRMFRYISALNPEYFDVRSFVPLMDHPFQSYLKNRTYQDIFRETIPCCLRAEDRQTAAFGLDNFLPFFDYRLVEFMFRIPGEHKIRDGVTKYLLRQAMRGVLPEETRTRVKKTGWNAPAHVWFSGKGREMLLDMVHSRVFRERGIYRVPEVLRLLEEHERIVSEKLPRDNHMMFFWQLVNLELWFERLEGHE